MFVYLLYCCNFHFLISNYASGIFGVSYSAFSCFKHLVYFMMLILIMIPLFFVLFCWFLFLDCLHFLLVVVCLALMLILGILLLVRSHSVDVWLPSICPFPSVVIVGYLSAVFFLGSICDCVSCFTFASGPLDFKMGRFFPGVRDDVLIYFLDGLILVRFH